MRRLEEGAEGAGEEEEAPPSLVAHLPTLPTLTRGGRRGEQLRRRQPRVIEACRVGQHEDPTSSCRPLTVGFWISRACPWQLSADASAGAGAGSARSACSARRVRAARGGQRVEGHDGHILDAHTSRTVLGICSGGAASHGIAPISSALRLLPRHACACHVDRRGHPMQRYREHKRLSGGACQGSACSVNYTSTLNLRRG